MKIQRNHPLLLLLLVSIVSILAITTISLSTSVYAQENQTKTTIKYPKQQKVLLLLQKDI